MGLGVEESYDFFVNLRAHGVANGVVTRDLLSIVSSDVVHQEVLAQHLQTRVECFEVGYSLGLYRTKIKHIGRLVDQLRLLVVKFADSALNFDVLLKLGNDELIHYLTCDVAMRPGRCRCRPKVAFQCVTSVEAL